MDIRNIKSNLNILTDNNLVKILYELFLQDIDKVTDNTPNVIYNKGDRVYIQENGKHQIYQCVAKQSSLSFIKDEWQYIVEVFDSQIDLTTNAIKIVEELHIIDSNTVNGIETQLDINEENTVAIYHGKKRYARDYDFKIDGNQILFNNPLNIGDRIILEVKHRVGVRAVGIILYDLNGNPYLVSVTDTGVISVIPHSEHSSTDIKYTEIVTGDCTYTLLVDASYSRPQLGLYKNINKYITGTDDRIYRIDVENGIVKLTDNTGFIGHSDKKYILGSDRNFYTVTDTEVTLVENHQMDPKDYEFGIKVITNEFEHRVIDIVNGEMILRKYITNGGYHNILLREGDNVYRLSLDDENELMLHSTLDEDTDHTSTDVLDAFYFFGEGWEYCKITIENGEVIYSLEDNISILPDSKGINMLNDNNETIKLISNVEDLILGHSVKVRRNGSFASPIEGFVVEIDGIEKIVTTNHLGDTLVIENTDMICRTNQHYIISEENYLYELQIVDNQPKFVRIDAIIDTVDEYRKGAFIKSKEMITKVTIKDDQLMFNPISTFMHRIKSTNGDSYMLGIDGNRLVTLYGIENDLGAGYLYIASSDGNIYKGYFDDTLKLVFTLADKDDEIDYELTSLLCTENGWFKLDVIDDTIEVVKIFDNIYESLMSYGNIVKRNLVVKSPSGKEFAIVANGNGEVEVREVKEPETIGLVISNERGFNYGVGIMDTLATYSTFIDNPNTKRRIPLLDEETGVVYDLMINGDKLSYDVSNSNTYDTECEIFDVDQNKFIIRIINGKLAVIKDE